MRRAPLCVVVAVTLFASARAWATPEDDAKDLFVRGRELRAANNCADATPLFRKAFELMPSGLGSLRNIAECEQMLGHAASARRAWLDLRRALLTSTEEKYAGWREEAEAAAAELAPRVASVRVDVVVSDKNGEQPASATTPGLELMENGATLPSALVGTELERDPGTYRLRAAIKGGAPVEESVTLAAGEHKVLRLRVVRPERPAEAPSPSPSSPSRGGEVPADRGWQWPAGWVAVGIGGASLVAAGVALGLRQGALSDLEAACPAYETSPCGESARDPVSRGQTMSTLTTAFGLAGIVLGGAGAALLLTAPSARTGLRVGPGQVAFRVDLD
ncbi:MAG: tetratricopeptide repeat protein [Myxococcales bacterium]|nr:tetratricopeptide repeat protein [Myxococcales bacterium]